MSAAAAGTVQFPPVRDNKKQILFYSIRNQVRQHILEMNESWKVRTLVRETICSCCSVPMTEALNESSLQRSER